MPSPSRGGGPAAMPKYQRIAAALRHEIEHAEHGPGGRLPSERTLAARYRVNRQTVRAALQQLREEGLIVTERRGTRSAVAMQPAGRGRALGGALQAYGVAPTGEVLAAYGVAPTGGVLPGYGAAPTGGALPGYGADRADRALTVDRHGETADRHGEAAERHGEAAVRGRAAERRSEVNELLPEDRPGWVDHVLPPVRPGGAGQGFPTEQHGGAADRPGRVAPAPAASPRAPSDGTA
ncbi:GntR family transcriptional regulator, partial [Streptomyces sp. NPDC032472]|uniref:GntR family transcriptional regulator n=1 Tax=Streptomyces sp. NPDC032472 TaxID=3155018 RepID=UPI0033D20CFF